VKVQVVNIADLQVGKADLVPAAFPIQCLKMFEVCAGDEKSGDRFRLPNCKSAMKASGEGDAEREANH
jgi:hypothetical protein